MSPSFFAELKRRNVLRATVLYAGAVWALAQGISQLGPAVGFPDWSTRWFLLVAVVGLPFWIAFAWIFEFTPAGIRRESEIAHDDSIARRTGRKLDFAIIAVLAVAVILLLGNQLVWHKGLAQAPSALAPALAKIPQKSVAVLPFANESGKPDEQFFSDGLSEDLINALSQIAGLKVISRNSAFQFRDSRDDAKTIGEKLGVAHLLEGSVRRLGDEVRISAELVNADDGSALWSQHYDRPYQDLFALQDGITQAVAGALKTKLLTAPGAVVQSDRPPGGNLAAYTAYQRGMAYQALGTEAGYRQAIDAFSQATRLDPHYAVAYAQLSISWSFLGNAFLSDEAEIAQANARARGAVNTALALDPDASPAHQARKLQLLQVDMDWTGAEAEARRALELAPNDASAQYGLAGALATLGQNRRAVDLVRQALNSDPRHANWYNWLATYLAALGRPDEARQAANTAIALQPGAADVHYDLAVIEILRGDAKAALTVAQQEPPGPWHEIAVTLALQSGADRAAADAALKKLIAAHAGDSAFQIAEVYALRKDPDAVFQWLDRTWSNRDPGIQGLLYDPLILRYQHDPRFAAYCKKAGLPTTTDAVAME
ncbi:MAG TPA: tetratricopeptide repeat protein [Rhodanobacteraceae bacterium]